MAEVYCIVNKTIKLADRTQKINLNEPLAYDNANAHAMRVTVFNDDGGPESLSGVGVVGSFMKADGNTVTPINGTVNGNVAEVILPLTLTQKRPFLKQAGEINNPPPLAIPITRKE